MWLPAFQEEHILVSLVFSEVYTHTNEHEFMFSHVSLIYSLCTSLQSSERFPEPQSNHSQIKTRETSEIHLFTNTVSQRDDHI